MSSPTQRAKQLLKRHGWSVAIVEKWNAFAPRPGGGKGVKQDLFGFIDLIVMRTNLPIIGIQVTSTSNMQARMDKSCENPMLKIWLSTGALFEVWGWSKKGNTGKQKRWMLDRQSVEHFEMEPIEIDIPGTIIRATKMI